MPADPPENDAEDRDPEDSGPGEGASATGDDAGSPAEGTEAAEGDDDGDRDDDGQEDEPAPAKRRRAAEARPKKKRKKKRKAPKPLPRTEAEIDAPTLQSLYMIGALATLTLVLWGSAKFACNAHPPQSRAPKAADIERVTKTPKDTAIEVQQRVAISDYPTALGLSAGDLAVELAPKAKACEGGACGQKIETLSRKVMTTGALLEATADGTAKVRVTSHAGDDTKPYLIDLRFAEGKWKAVRRVPDDGTYRPPALPTALVPPGDAAAAPPASAGPSAAPGPVPAPSAAP